MARICLLPAACCLQSTKTTIKSSYTSSTSLLSHFSHFTLHLIFLISSEMPVSHLCALHGSNIREFCRSVGPLHIAYTRIEVCSNLALDFSDFPAAVFFT